MSDYYVHEEDGTSHFVLEDDSGDLILEAGFSVISRAVAIDGVAAVTVVGHIEAEVERSVAVSGVASISVSGAGPFAPSRITQAPVEVALVSTSKLRTTQSPVEVAVAAADTPLRVTQAPVEVAVAGASASRTTQAPVEVILYVSRETFSVAIVDYAEFLDA